ncbi:MAG: hypothetical protein COT36_01840 [Parcubacteria group bacterium CG08_land_8_20_14_0_20_38_56]|nr:MAG: hypothetical protein COT36_01840 [Parcubacteria group bacterium CG08_land_8_20_14_0_20_38_56]
MAKNSNANILVTGATGFIGSHLCKELVKRGYPVFGLSFSKGIKNQIIKSLLKQKNFHFKKGDVRDFNALNRIIKNANIKVIFHLAAVLPNQKELKDPFVLLDINTRGTLNLLHSAYCNGVDKFIYSSTSSVYSEPPEYLPVDENHPTLPPTFYGASKLGGELYCRVYSKAMNVVVLRYCGAYGVGQDEHYATHRFVQQALNNKPITIYSSGNQTTDFTYIGDIVNGSILAMEKAKGGTFNISSGQETSIRKLAETVIKLTNSKSKIVFSGKKTDRPFRFVLDITKARKILGYSPLSFSEGLSKYISEIKVNRI